jgi:acetoacetate decarboxylase
MPMSTETAVIFGRELFAEPKKIADIQLTERATPGGGIEARGTVTRHGITYIQLDAIFESEPAPVTQSGDSDHYYFKYLPAADGRGLAHDPELVRVRHRGTTFASVRGTGRITFRESQHDPIIDLPVLEVTGAGLSEVQTITHAEVVATVPQAQFLPYAYGKQDDLLLWEGDVTAAEMGLVAATA